jgi:hypothetical protein
MSAQAEVVLASVLRACDVIATQDPERAEHLRHLALTPERQAITWRIVELSERDAFLVADVDVIDDDGTRWPVVGIDAAALITPERADEILAQLLDGITIPDDISTIDGDA